MNEIDYSAYNCGTAALKAEERRRMAEAEEQQRQAAHDELLRRMKNGETLTDILMEQMPKTPDKTAEEQQSDRAFVSMCRARNPFTRRFCNLSHQIALIKIDEPTADELREAAQYEDVDFTRANPGLADMDRAKMAKEVVTQTVKRLRKDNALVGEDFVL